MATVINDAQSSVGSPYVLYDLVATYKDRTQTTVTISYTLTGWLQYSSSYLGTGYSITPTVYFGGASESFTLKSSSSSWSGTTKHSISGTIKVTGLSATTKSISTALSVAATDSGRMSKKSGTALAIKDYNAQSGWSVNTHSANLDGSISLTINPIQSTNQHTIKATDGTKTVTLISKSSGTSKVIPFKAATFGSWFSTTSKTKTVTLLMTTYNEAGTALGTKESQSFTLTMLSSQGNPTGASLGLLNLTDIGGAFKVTKPTYKYGATFKSYSVTASSGTATYNGVETVTHVANPSIEGGVTITLSFTDSRGFISNVASIKYVPELTKFLVWVGGVWKKAMPYVYSGGVWKKAIGYIYTGSAWKK